MNYKSTPFLARFLFFTLLTVFVCQSTVLSSPLSSPETPQTYLASSGKGVLQSIEEAAKQLAGALSKTKERFSDSPPESIEEAQVQLDRVQSSNLLEVTAVGQNSVTLTSVDGFSIPVTFGSNNPVDPSLPSGLKRFEGPLVLPPAESSGEYTLAANGLVDVDTIAKSTGSAATKARELAAAFRTASTEYSGIETGNGLTMEELKGRVIPEGHQRRVVAWVNPDTMALISSGGTATLPSKKMPEAIGSLVGDENFVMYDGTEDNPNEGETAIRNPGLIVWDANFFDTEEEAEAALGERIAQFSGALVVYLPFMEDKFHAYYQERYEGVQQTVSWYKKQILDRSLSVIEYLLGNTNGTTVGETERAVEAFEYFKGERFKKQVITHIVNNPDSPGSGMKNADQYLGIEGNGIFWPVLPKNKELTIWITGKSARDSVNAFGKDIGKISEEITVKYLLNEYPDLAEGDDGFEETPERVNHLVDAFFTDSDSGADLIIATHPFHSVLLNKNVRREIGSRNPQAVIAKVFLDGSEAHLHVDDERLVLDFVKKRRISLSTPLDMFAYALPARDRLERWVDQKHEYGIFGNGLTTESWNKLNWRGNGFQSNPQNSTTIGSGLVVSNIKRELSEDWLNDSYTRTNTTSNIGEETNAPVASTNVLFLTPGAFSATTYSALTEGAAPNQRFTLITTADLEEEAYDFVGSLDTLSERVSIFVMKGTEPGNIRSLLRRLGAVDLVIATQEMFNHNLEKYFNLSRTILIPKGLDRNRVDETMKQDMMTLIGSGIFA